MNTWGISGPTFLAIYGMLLGVTAAAVAIDRLGGSGGMATAEADDDLDDYEVAVLNGEEGLAVSVALMRLDRAGAVELGDRLLRELAETQDLDIEWVRLPWSDYAAA